MGWSMKGWAVSTVQYSPILERHVSWAVVLMMLSSVACAVFSPPTSCHSSPRLQTLIFKPVNSLFNSPSFYIPAYPPGEGEWSSKISAQPKTLIMNTFPTQTLLLHVRCLCNRSVWQLAFLADSLLARHAIFPIVSKDKPEFTWKLLESQSALSYCVWKSQS